jgi:hypothetical protein
VGVRAAARVESMQVRVSGVWMQHSVCVTHSPQHAQQATQTGLSCGAVQRTSRFGGLECSTQSQPRPPPPPNLKHRISFRGPSRERQRQLQNSRVVGERCTSHTTATRSSGPRYVLNACSVLMKHRVTRGRCQRCQPSEEREGGGGQDSGCCTHTHTHTLKTLPKHN